MSTTEDDVKNAIAGNSGQPENNPWPARLQSFTKFSEQFHRRGTEIERRYEDARDDGSPDLAVGLKKANLFFSNVAVIKESLFNSLPKPDVKRLHTGEWDNEPARVAALIIERSLNYEIKKAPGFEESIKHAIFDRLVPGLGTVWIEYHAPEGDTPEYITVEPVYWKDLIWEPQRIWRYCGWVGRKVTMSTQDAKAKWPSMPDPNNGLGKGNTAAASIPEQAIMTDKTVVIQMWDTINKKIIWMTESGFVLEEVEDEYKIQSFLPTPKPLIANEVTRKFLPVPDYYIAQDQYLQLDTLYSRISLIIQAVRVAGVYDSQEQGLSRMLDGNENVLIPVDNWAMFQEKGGVKGAIDWFPVEQVAQVLTNLTSAYTFVKGELFEVTGMADIVRGNSNQYETASAQQIKAQFASVRLNGFQRDTSAFVRDVLIIIAQLQISLYSVERMSQICGQLPMEDQEFVPQALELLKTNFMHQAVIDIEADSLTQADWSLQQQQRMGYVQALSQFIQSALPTAEAVPQLAPLLIAIIKFASVGFKGSAELEGILDNALNNLQQQPPQQKEGPSPEEQKMQADLMKMQEEFKLKQQEAMAQLRMKQEEHAMDMQQQQQKFQQQMTEMEERHRLAMQQLSDKISMQREQNEVKKEGGIIQNAIKRLGVKKEDKE